MSSASSSSPSKPKPPVILIVHGEHAREVADYLVRRVWEHAHGRDWKRMAYEQPLLDLAKALYPREIDDLAIESPDRKVIEPHPGRPAGERWTTHSILHTLEAILDDDVALPRPRVGRTVLLDTLVVRIQEARKNGRPDLVVTVATKRKADILREELPALFPRVCYLDADTHLPAPDKIADALKEIE